MLRSKFNFNYNFNVMKCIKLNVIFFPFSKMPGNEFRMVRSWFGNATFNEMSLSSMVYFPMNIYKCMYVKVYIYKWMNVVRPCHVVMFGQFDVGPFSSVGYLLISALYLFFRFISIFFCLYLLFILVIFATDARGYSFFLYAFLHLPKYNFHLLLRIFLKWNVCNWHNETVIGIVWKSP